MPVETAGLGNPVWAEHLECEELIGTRRAKGSAAQIIEEIFANGEPSTNDPMKASRRTAFPGTSTLHNPLDRLPDDLQIANNTLSVRQEASPCAGKI